MAEYPTGIPNKANQMHSKCHLPSIETVNQHSRLLFSCCVQMRRTTFVRHTNAPDQRQCSESSANGGRQQPVPAHPPPPHKCYAPSTEYGKSKCTIHNCNNVHLLFLLFNSNFISSCTQHVAGMNTGPSKRSRLKTNSFYMRIDLINPLLLMLYE